MDRTNMWLTIIGMVTVLYITLHTEVQMDRNTMFVTIIAIISFTIICLFGDGIH